MMIKKQLALGMLALSLNSCAHIYYPLQKGEVIATAYQKCEQIQNMQGEYLRCPTMSIKMNYLDAKELIKEAMGEANFNITVTDVNINVDMDSLCPDKTICGFVNNIPEFLKQQGSSLIDRLGGLK